MIKKITHNGSEKVVVFKRLTKIYDEKTAVDSLSAEIPSGCYGLLGPNGAGKTTTILMLMGLVRPTSGTAEMLGHDIVEDPINARERVGYIPENVGFYPNMTAIEHVQLMADLRGRPRQDPEAILEWVGLDRTYWNKKVRKYSQGMRQRLGIAQAFTGDVSLVIMDEPLSNLDPLGRNDIMRKIIQKVDQGISVIISSHVTLEVEHIADHIGIIYNGKMLVSGDLNEIAIHHGIHDFEIQMDSDRVDDVVEVLQSEAGEHIISIRAAGSRILVETMEPHCISTALGSIDGSLRLKPLSGSLGDIYIKRVGGP